MTCLARKGYDSLTYRVFDLLHEKKLTNGDAFSLDDVARELRRTPDCFKETPLNVIGWWYHLEYELSPWQDDYRLWYRGESYVQKEYLCPNSYGGWNLRDDIFKETFLK